MSRLSFAGRDQLSFAFRNRRINCSFVLREHHPSPTQELCRVRQQRVIIPSLQCGGERGSLLFLPTSHRLQQSLVTEGHSSLLLPGPAQQYPTGLSSSIITGNLISVSCWALPPCAFESECFFPPSKELITFTAWYWNLWTELNHSSAKLDWFHLPHSRKLDILQLSFCFPV